MYTLLFADHGLSAGRISLLFIAWSLTSFVCEVPSGAWADTIDRRLLLVVSAAVQAAAFSCWLLRPSTAGFAPGFVPWGLSSAIMSGTFESLLCEELAHRGAVGAHPRPSPSTPAPPPDRDAGCRCSSPCWDCRSWAWPEV